jgi:hypothetical protein
MMKIISSTAMNTERSRRIQGVGGFSALLTPVQRDATRYRDGVCDLNIEADNGDLFVIRMNQEQNSPAFVTKLISAFRFNPNWREHFRVFTRPHSTAELRYADGSIGRVDLALQTFVQALNDQGFATTASCEGDHHPMGRVPSISFVEDMPPALEAVWTSLGWVNLDRSVCPIACHGFNQVFRQMFFIILDDWLFGSLDITGKRYRTERVASPLIPELPPMNVRALNDHQKQVTKLVKKMNTLGAQASFDDLVKLRCGRDSYSLMKLPALLEALEGDPAIHVLKTKVFTTPDMQKALRWRMRGLDVEMILKKHEVDQVLEAKALARKQERTDRVNAESGEAL